MRKVIRKKVLGVVLALCSALLLLAPSTSAEAAEPTQDEINAFIASLNPVAPPCDIVYKFSDGETYEVTPAIAMTLMKTNADGSFYIDPTTNYYALDYDKCAAVVGALAIQHSKKSTSNSVDFVTHDGETIHYDGISYSGWTVDTQNETLWLMNAIMTFYNGEHEMTYKMGGYVEVDISDQHAWYYDDNGNVVWDSDVVTGNTSRGNGTTLGYWTITKYMTTNTTLVGENYASPVSYWMPFKGNSEGLHDATWRSSFGGQIYKTSGSHGCVNLPYAKAKSLYSLVHVGTPVIVHQ